MGILWAKSGSIEFDNSAVRAAGAKAYFYAGGTTTPLAVYQDADEATPHSDPVVADANGRWPDVFIPYTASYDLKVTTSGGTQLYYPTEIPNPNPVEAAASSVTDDEKWQTGDVKFKFITGTLTGYVRANGRTIGNAASGGTERANADTVNLFTHLYDNFANTILAVSGGRGANAAADYGANKTITLPDMRSGVPIGVDDMGNSAAGRAASITFANGNSTTGGSHLGANTHTITEAQLPNHTHSFSATSSSNGAHTHTGSTGDNNVDHNHTGTTSSDGAHTHTTPFLTAIGDGGGPPNTGLKVGTGTNISTTSDGAHTHTFTTSGQNTVHQHAFTTDSGGAHTHTVSGTTGTGSGSGTAHNIVQYGVSGSYYIKL